MMPFESKAKPPRLPQAPAPDLPDICEVEYDRWKVYRIEEGGYEYWYVAEDALSALRQHIVEFDNATVDQEWEEDLAVVQVRPDRLITVTDEDESVEVRPEGCGMTDPTGHCLGCGRNVEDVLEGECLGSRWEAKRVSKTAKTWAEETSALTQLCSTCY